MNQPYWKDWERGLERGRERERGITFPLSLSLLVEDGNPSKKLAPNCTNTCHRKFAEIKY